MGIKRFLLKRMRIGIIRLQNYNQQITFLFPSLTETERVEFYNTFKNQIEQFNSYVELRYKQNKSILDTLFSYQSILQGLMFSSESKVQKQVIAI